MSRNFTAASSMYLNLSITMGYPMTMSCWIQPTNASGTHALMSSSKSSGTNKFMIDLASSGTVAGCTVDDGVSQSRATGGASVTVSAWNHVVGVFTSSTSRTCYVNGVAGTASTTSKSPGNQTNYSTGSVLSGGVRTNYYDGLLAESAWWNKALTANEITMLYRGVCPLDIHPDNGLRSYWPLDGWASPEIDYNRIGQQSLTVNNSPTRGATHPPVTPFSKRFWPTRSDEPPPQNTLGFFALVGF